MLGKNECARNTQHRTSHPRLENVRIGEFDALALCFGTPHPKTSPLRDPPRGGTRIGQDGGARWLGEGWQVGGSHIIRFTVADRNVSTKMFGTKQTRSVLQNPGTNCGTRRRDQGWAGHELAPSPSPLSQSTTPHMRALSSWCLLLLLLPRCAATTAAHPCNPPPPSWAPDTVCAGTGPAFIWVLSRQVIGRVCGFEPESVHTEERFRPVLPVATSAQTDFFGFF